MLAAAATGTVISYTDSQAASASFEVQQGAKGVRTGRGKSATCTKPPKQRRKPSKLAACVYYATLGSFTHADVAGANRMRFSGRLRGSKLEPGEYRLRAIARSAGGKSAPRTAAFRITR